MSNNKINLETDLVAQLNKGSVTAFNEIYNRCFQLMFVFAYKKLRDEDLARDFVQELFTKLWLKREKISPEGNLLQYLYISLRSDMFTYFNHQKVQSKYIDFLANFALTTAEGTDYLIREKQLEAYIEKQIEKLPKKMRTVFEKSRKELLSNREIALESNTTESNISHHITSAVNILKRKFGAKFNTYPYDGE